MKYSRKIKELMLKAGLFHLLSHFSEGKQVAILRYHSIINPEDNFYASPSIAIYPEIFEMQVAYFSKYFNIISLDKVRECIDSHKPFPKRSVVFTFDDGYRDNYFAYKILKKYYATGTFYIASACIDNASVLWLFEVIYLVNNTQQKFLNFIINGSHCTFSLLTIEQRQFAIRRVTEIIKSNTLLIREDIRNQLREQTEDVKDYQDRATQVMLTWKQVKEMSDNGMTIGGHTRTHLNLPNAELFDAENEIVGCKKEIESHIGREVLHFSYPNGGGYDYYNNNIKELVKKAGYLTSTTSNNGVSNYYSDPFELSRIRITPYLSEIAYQVCAEPLLNR